MNSEVSQTMSPVNHLGRSRLLTTIVGLVALVFVLAAVFIYLQSRQKIQQPIPTNNNVLSAEVKAQYMNHMQAVVESQPALAPAQKAALMSAMSSKLKINK